MLSYSNIIAVRLETPRTYDDVVDCVIRELGIRPYMVIKVRSFLEFFKCERNRNNYVEH